MRRSVLASLFVALCLVGSAPAAADPRTHVVAAGESLSGLAARYDGVDVPLTVLGRDRAEVEKSARGYLDKVGIGDKADVYPAQLSGGQQQRAAIARALCMEPEALLFDEPTSALDPELEQEVVRVIKDLAREGRTMMIVTHDMKMAGDVSDHVIFLHQGLIEEEGAPDTLFGQPKSERLRQFLSSTMAA